MVSQATVMQDVEFHPGSMPLSARHAPEPGIFQACNGLDRKRMHARQHVAFAFLAFRRWGLSLFVIAAFSGLTLV
jgi:hypothetical protein